MLLDYSVTYLPGRSAPEPALTCFPRRCDLQARHEQLGHVRRHLPIGDNGRVQNQRRSHDQRNTECYHIHIVRHMLSSAAMPRATARPWMALSIVAYSAEIPTVWVDEEDICCGIDALRTALKPSPDPGQLLHWRFGIY